MAEIGMQTDANEVMMKFKDFTLKEMKITVKSALMKAARYLTKQTKNDLKHKLPNATRRNKSVYKDTLLDAVRYKANKDGDVVKVHIMGSRSRYSGTFRTRFFEKGTEERFRKIKVRDKDSGMYSTKQVSCGSIKPLYFFKDSQEQAKAEIDRVIEQTLVDKVNEINQKKF